MGYGFEIYILSINFFNIYIGLYYSKYIKEHNNIDININILNKDWLDRELSFYLKHYSKCDIITSGALIKYNNSKLVS